MEALDIFSYFLLLLLLLSGVKVVTTSNVIHAAIFLVFTLATTAVLFILLSAEFVALVLILVYIGAVIVLFLFGVMITRAPLGPNAELDNDLLSYHFQFLEYLLIFFYKHLIQQ